MAEPQRIEPFVHINRPSDGHMSEPIKAGDLVVVVRGHECGLGTMFSVESLHQQTTREYVICRDCGAVIVPKGSPETLAFGQDLYFSLWRLQRIPPLADLETTELEEELPLIY